MTLMQDQEAKELLERQKNLTAKISKLYSNTIISSPIDIILLQEELASALYERAKVFLKLGWGIQAIHDYQRALGFSPSQKLYKDITKVAIEAEVLAGRYGRAKTFIEMLQELGDHSEDHRLEFLSSTSSISDCLIANGMKVTMIGGSSKTQNVTGMPENVGEVKCGIPISEPKNRMDYIKELNRKYFNGTKIELKWDPVKGIGVYASWPIKEGAKILPNDVSFIGVRDCSFCFHCGKKGKRKLCQCGISFCSNECKSNAEEYHKVLCNTNREAFEKMLNGVKSGNNVSSLFYVIVGKILATAKARNISWKEIPVIKYLMTTDCKSSPNVSCDLDTMIAQYTRLCLVSGIRLFSGEFEITDLVNLLNFLQAYCFSEVEDKVAMLTFFVSFANHSCSSNALLKKDGLFTEKDIAKGQEILIDYLFSVKLPIFARRLRLFVNYGFICKCEKCGDDKFSEEKIYQTYSGMMNRQ